MIPDWFQAFDQAITLPKPGGLLGVVDFLVSRKHEDDPHSWFTRTFWPAWFACDNVYLCADHVPYLDKRLTRVSFNACSAKVPYMLGLSVPYYAFIGKKVD